MEGDQRGKLLKLETAITGAISDVYAHKLKSTGTQYGLYAWDSPQWQGGSLNSIVVDGVEGLFTGPHVYTQAITRAIS